MAITTFLKKNKYFLGFAILLIATLGVVFGGRYAQPSSTAPQAGKSVSLIRIGDYLKVKNVTLDNGNVESLDQADLRAQFSAPLSEIRVTLGDPVANGQIIAVLKNNDLLAQLDQAKAGLRAANAGLDALIKGARPEDLLVSQTSADQARMNLNAAIEDAYAKSDDAVRNHIDKFFLNPRETFAEFSIILYSGGHTAAFSSGDLPQKELVDRQKYQLELILNEWQRSFSASSKLDDPVNALALAKTNLQKLIAFMNAMSPLVNDLSTDDALFRQSIDGYKTEFSVARSTVSGTLAGLLGAETGWKMAEASLKLKTAGPTVEQLKLQEAQVSQAMAVVSNLQAQVDKTYVRSPVTGKVSFLDARIGELVSPGTLIATVVNPDALQVKTYASENDLKYISANDLVLVGGGATGRVFRISPAIDPQTKKVEVIVSIDKRAGGGIVVGQTVSLAIQSKLLAAEAPVYLLPVQAVKTNSASYLFSVDRNGVVFQVPVKTGNLAGENIEVIGDLNPDLMIIASAMGLAPGEKVLVKQ
jgi:multidrug efflux pump subunit AcrA (membrane-fusion protein)